MNISNLNKTINLFLVGASSIISIAIIVYFTTPNISEVLIRDFNLSKDITTSLQVIIILMTMSLLIFIGLIIESISLIIRETTRSYLRKRPKLKKIITSLFLGNVSINKMDAYKKYFYKNSSSFKDDIYIRGSATQLLFNKAPEHSIKWAAEHHATYLLIFNYIVLVLINMAILLYNGYYSTLIGGIVLIYLLGVLALDKFAYAYTLVFRFAATHLLNNKEEDSPQTTTHKT